MKPPAAAETVTEEEKPPKPALPPRPALPPKPPAEKEVASEDAELMAELEKLKGEQAALQAKKQEALDAAARDGSKASLAAVRYARWRVEARRAVERFLEPAARRPGFLRKRRGARPASGGTAAARGTARGRRATAGRR